MGSSDKERSAAAIARGRAERWPDKNRHSSQDADDARDRGPDHHAKIEKMKKAHQRERIRDPREQRAKHERGSGGKSEQPAGHSQAQDAINDPAEAENPGLCTCQTSTAIEKGNLRGRVIIPPNPIASV
jgi:hypothetical protein